MITEPALAEALEACQADREEGRSPAEAGFDALLARWPNHPGAIEAVAEAYDDYLREVIGQLKSHGVRAELDDSSDRMAKKIRTHTKDKVPFQLIAGEEDKANGSVSFRFRDGTQENGVPIADAIERITEAIATKAQV